MSPEIAVIKTETNDYPYNKKLCGLYPLERNIMILARKGVKKIYLHLSEEETLFFQKKIKKHLKNINETELIEDASITELSGNYLSIPSNLFMQAHHIDEFENYFKASKPVINDKQFQLNTDADIKRASGLVSGYIIANTGGFLAQKINKRISIPISSVLAKTRVHPNYLTVFNMLIGIMSSVFVCMAARAHLSAESSFLMEYSFMALGGLFFQLASILDGVDGEVAKFTFKVSRIGGILDTVSDNLTLIMFLVSASYIHHVYMGDYLDGCFSLISILVMTIGVIILFILMISYISKHSDTGSFVAYDKDFMQKLPESDFLVSFIHKMKYGIKKEFFSIAFFLFGLAGMMYIVIPVVAFVVFFASIIASIVHFRYIGKTEIWKK
ncbi:MAG: CDP-alcohol phosphatidyltransferase family protein [bacterium]|nr:CDP-alcohol phosphatidyltransferase family protein [bacterium]